MTGPSSTRARNRENLARYRHGLAALGLCRVEVVVPVADATVIRGIAEQMRARAINPGELEPAPRAKLKFADWLKESG